MTQCKIRTMFTCFYVCVCVYVLVIIIFFSCSGDVTFIPNGCKKKIDIIKPRYADVWIKKQGL